MQHLASASLGSCGRSVRERDVAGRPAQSWKSCLGGPVTEYGRRSKVGPFGLYLWYRTRSECALTLVRMPLEGQWARQHTPIKALPRRTRRTLVVVAAILALAAVVTLAFTFAHSDASTA